MKQRRDKITSSIKTITMRESKKEAIVVIKSFLLMKSTQLDKCL